jgi:Kef-type K+ transport system membrane component KefB
MHEMTLGNSIFLIFTGAALLATLALFARQAMIVAYILLGIIVGPWGLGYIADTVVITEISNIGIIFLLYLLGLDLFPQQLWKMFGEASVATLASSAIFWLIGFVTGYVFGFPALDSILIGVALMFSSTIIGVKLLPTTILHHRHTGQIIISVLLLQDLLAILVLLLLQGYGKGNNLMLDILWQVATLPMLMLIAWLIERYILVKLITRFDQIHEYIFLLAIAWCLGIAELAVLMGLSHEIGAFIAGVTLASSPIAMFITERLKPLRDFFLIIFFFALGATFDMGFITGLMLPAAVLALLVIIVKPMVFAALFEKAGEKQEISVEVGFRLGQISEFSMLIAVLAVNSKVISENTSSLIQLTALMTFILSTYIIVKRYPTPIAVSDRLRRD